ncbi:MAG: ABC transporter permease [Ignavibacteriales bacterium]|nr:ABC transporter permease [Ignavibacteriales bacterium]MCB9260212.1 ABC transporter permease [Ignavibacteriales bacterium]
MSKSLIIARWEFIERIKNKSFIISMILLPLLLIGFSLLPTFLLNKGNDFPLPLGIIDLTKKYHKEFSNQVVQNYLPDGQPAFFTFNLATKTMEKSALMKFADKQVLSDGIVGYVIIEENPDLKISFRTKEIFNPDKLNIIENSFNKASIIVNGIEGNISPDKIQLIKSKIAKIEKSYIDAKDETDIIKSFINSYLFIILLITMILFSGGMFVRSLVQEKSNRIIELILSSCTSKELLLGKVLGLSFFGLFQLIIWMIIGIVLHKTNSLDFELIKNLHYQILFFIIGYVFYSSIFIGLGSIVNTDHEAQQLTGFISIFLIFPIILAVEIIRAPNSILSLFLSYFPLTSVPVMLLRLNSTDPTLLEVVSIILVLLFSLYIIIFISSKLFRIGILRSGKKPSVKEIISWIKLK